MLDSSRRFVRYRTRADVSVESGGNVSAVQARSVHDTDEVIREREDLIDDQLAHSFPASDPPSWVQGTSPEPV